MKPSVYPLLKPSLTPSVKPFLPSDVLSNQLSLSITPSNSPSENTIYIPITNICKRNEDMLIIEYKSDWTSRYKIITIGVKNEGSRVDLR